MNKEFFTKASVSNRTVQVTDIDAILPAIGDKGEVRVRLPTRRRKTLDERQGELQNRYDTIATLEESIETERKALLDLVKAFRESGTGGMEVVVKNDKIKTLMEKRSSLAHPLRWIEGVEGLNFKDIFESKRDVRKLGHTVFQVKRRVEPIEGLYVDLGRAAEQEALSARATPAAAASEPVTAAAPSISDIVDSITAAATDATKAATTGAIIAQQKKKSYKLKTPGPPLA